MRNRVVLFLGVLAVVGASAVLATARADSRVSAATGAGTSPKPGSAQFGGSALLKGTGVMRWGSTFIEGNHYERFAYVLVSSDNARAAARMPGISLVYMSAASIQRSWSTGVSFTAASKHGWLLRDTSGNALMNDQYGAFVADIGERAYQQRFVSNVASLVARTKVDGVFIDDVVGDFVGLTGGAVPARYPTQKAWENAMVAFVSNVGQALKARGIYVVANAGRYTPGDRRSDTGELTAAFWRRLGASVNGLTTEYWLQAPTDKTRLRGIGSRWDENWAGWQALVAVAQRTGADFFGLMYGPAGHGASMRFGRGSFLLDWDGGGGAFMYAIDDGPDPRHPDWVVQLGKPLGSKVERGIGIWQRRYEGGYVVVNASEAVVRLQVGARSQVIPALDTLFVRSQARDR